MPYVNGERVSLAQFKALNAKPAVVESVTEEQEDAILGKPSRKSRSSIVKNAAAAATGIMLEDDVPQIGVESE